MDFREVIVEKVEVDADEVGITAYGDILSVFIAKAKSNDLMELEIKGSKVLGKVKSLETLKGEYKEEDWDNLEKLYAKYTHNASTYVEKAIKEFEKNINIAIKNLELMSKKL